MRVDTLRSYQTSRSTVVEMKERQSAKIREIKVALITAGVSTLDGQAKVLGLCRSTAWTILRGNHKASGLSATTVKRVLEAPRLPPFVRARIFEYVKEKAAGRYGHSKSQRHKFIARCLTIDSSNMRFCDGQYREPDEYP
jgi:hypothetical protein